MATLNAGLPFQAGNPWSLPQLESLDVSGSIFFKASLDSHDVDTREPDIEYSNVIDLEIADLQHHRYELESLGDDQSFGHPNGSESTLTSPAQCWSLEHQIEETSQTFLDPLATSVTSIGQNLTLKKDDRKWRAVPHAISQATFTRCARLNRRLEHWRHPLPTIATLAACINDTLEVIPQLVKEQRGAAAQKQVSHMLEDLVNHLCQLAEANSISAAQATDQEVLATLLRDLPWADSPVRDVFVELAARLAMPAIVSLLRQAGVHVRGQLLSANPNAADFLDQYMQQADLTESRQSQSALNIKLVADDDLQLLDHIKHSLAIASAFHGDGTSIQVEIDLEGCIGAAVDPDIVLQRARDYEAQIMAALGETRSSNVSTQAVAYVSGSPSPKSWAAISFQLDDHSPTVNSKNSDMAQALNADIARVLQRRKAHTDPSLRSCHYLMSPLRPLLDVQARLINGRALRTLLRESRLDHHIECLRRYCLFGNGALLGRLQILLSDARGSKLSLAATQASRMTGPERRPASLDIPLRTALHQLLEDFLPSRAADRQGFNEHLNFVFQQDHDSDLTIDDPFSLQALDRVQLHYNTPASLDSILSGQVIHKYQRLSTKILRLVRIASLTTIATRQAHHLEALSRSTRQSALRFVHTAHITVSTILSHVTLSFTDPLVALDADLAFLAQALDDEDGAKVSYGTYIDASPNDIAALVDSTLDSLLIRSCLGDRLESSSAALEDVQSLVLRGCAVVDALARSARADGRDTDDAARQAETLGDVRRGLEAATKRFIASLRAAAGDDVRSGLLSDIGQQAETDEQDEDDRHEETSLPLTDEQCLVLLAEALDL